MNDIELTGRVATNLEMAEILKQLIEEIGVLRKEVDELNRQAITAKYSKCACKRDNPGE